MSDASEPVRYFDRYTGRIETEQIYGEGALRWIYETGSGKCALETVAKRPFFSRFYGWRMRRAKTAARVAPFIETYGLDENEFADPASSFRSFNEFFYRKLKPEARPIAGGEDNVVFPADGRHLAVPDVSAMEQFFVKGQKFDLKKLLGDVALAGRYAKGTLVLSRLCPVDYHRYHFCASGEASEAKLLNGSLYSVSPLALRRQLAYFWENKRMLTELETERFGGVLCLEIGATCVGTIEQTFAPGSVGKGDEKGYFAFGGSATITIFEPGKIRLADDLAEQSAEGVELYARMGDVMGSAV